MNSECEECSTSSHQFSSTQLHSHLNMDEDDELLKYIWREYLHPKQYEWVLIAGYIVVFFVSLIGNTLGKFCYSVQSVDVLIDCFSCFLLSVVRWPFALMFFDMLCINILVVANA